MRRMFQYLLLFLAGLMGGLLVAQGLIILAGRTGGNFGGEVFTILAIPLLLVAGFAAGRENRSLQDYEKAFQEGYEDGIKDAIKQPGH